jgi:hypothetical protein
MLNCISPVSRFSAHQGWLMRGLSGSVRGTSFPILDPERGYITIKISEHPPFPALGMLNGHE